MFYIYFYLCRFACIFYFKYIVVLRVYDCGFNLILYFKFINTSMVINLPGI